MNEIPIDPSVFRKITIPEIHKIIKEFCKDANKLVTNYSNYFCRNHDDLHGFEISKVDEHIFSNATGIKLYNEWVYRVYTPVRWNTICKKCGNEQMVCFQFHISTNELENVKKELEKIELSEENMMYGKLANYSHYQFFDGRLSFEKVTSDIGT